MPFCVHEITCGTYFPFWKYLCSGYLQESSPMSVSQKDEMSLKVSVMVKNKMSDKNSVASRKLISLQQNEKKRSQDNNHVRRDLMDLNWSMWGTFYSESFLESLFWNNICRQYVISLYIHHLINTGWQFRKKKKKCIWAKFATYSKRGFCLFVLFVGWLGVVFYFFIL